MPILVVVIEQEEEETLRCLNASRVIRFVLALEDPLRCRFFFFFFLTRPGPKLKLT
jgi:hypothetical protein